MKCAVFFIALSTVLAGANAAAAQPQSAKSKKSAGKPAIAPAMSVPAFEPRLWESGVPLQSYEANKPDLVFKWLGDRIGRVPGVPDKFSPPEQELKWQAAIAASLADMRPIAIAKDCAKQYDPAKQQYRITITTFAPNKKLRLGPHALDLRTLQLATETRKKEVYIAENGYGAKFEVTKKLEENWSFMYPGLPGHEPTSVFKDPEKEKKYFAERERWLKSPESYAKSMLESGNMFRMSHYELVVPMNSDDARANESNIGCLFVLSLQPPFIRAHDAFLPASSRDPRETTIYGRYFYGDLDRLIIYNKVTGTPYVEAKREGI